MKILKLSFPALLGLILSMMVSCNQGTQQQTETAEETAVPAEEPPMPERTITMVVSHHVKDFQTWRSVFEAHDSVRGAHQLSTLGLFQGIDDPNYVMVSAKVGNLEEAQKFVASEDLKTAMQNAGVVDTPEVNFYEILFMDEAVANATDLRFFAIHKVQDFDTFKKVFDAHEADRTADGLTVVTIARNLNDPNEVAVAATSEDPGALERHLQNPAIQEAMKEAGVIGEPSVIVAKKATTTAI